ncbi:MAG TPA: methyltransferase domain-containing protein [Pyrinomonadaceae bacterium]
MKEKLLTYLVCPSCAGKLLLSVKETQDGEIITGELGCDSCSRMFPILRGVPRFSDLETVASDKQETAENFGWQWTHFTQEDTRYADQFLGWLQPVTPEFFKGKVVIEGGCGKGRHTQLAAEWGARDVVGIDLSAAVETAYTATRHLPNAHIVQTDIYNLPLDRSFDYAFSVGVLHHLPDPKGGFESLASKVKPGGHISAWVYGAENNEWITRWVNPVREKLTSRMNQRALLQLSKIPAASVYLATKLIYGPLNKSRTGESIAKHLFYNDYLKAIAPFGWREQHTIVFDHLVAPTAFYLSRQEFEKWWSDIGAKDVVITWHNKNSWCGFGRTPPD